MAELKKPGAVTLSVADLCGLVGETLTDVKVDRSGTSDDNAVTLIGKEGVIKFSKADLLDLVRRADGFCPAVIDGVRGEVLEGAKHPDAPRLPMKPAHLDGRPLDHVDAAIHVDRSGADDSDAVTLRFLA